ncbi:hypothetical protein XYCOK13_16680 [Xylanibacillus composti]|uniref:Uncharacterized protein n=1 Tax=Xylanibacillus composti TaxID=1572762 RepID=A0A8J4H4P9_9BACL|nr:hypothetical protein [Xylanibacillus composti]GIQ68844.1 hypothetical protein XYCOK13_16680 [Xylanibacillus composti]
MLLNFRKEFRELLNIHPGDRVAYKVEGSRVMVMKSDEGYKVNATGQANIPKHVVNAVNLKENEVLVIDKVQENVAYLTVRDRRFRQPKLKGHALKAPRKLKLANKLGRSPIDQYVNTLQSYGFANVRKNMFTHDIARMLRGVADLLESKENEKLFIRFSLRDPEIYEYDYNEREYKVILRKDDKNHEITYETTAELQDVAAEVEASYPGYDVVYIMPNIV